MESLGRELRKERELRGISLQDIAKTTKISVSFLKALEDDRLNILPGEFFVKGTIRAYAQCIGLDEDMILNLYYQSFLYQEEEARRELKKEKQMSSPGRKRKVVLVFAAAAAVLAVITLLVVLIPSGRPVFVPAEQTGFVKPVGIPSPAKKTAPAVPSQGGRDFRLEFLFEQETWIQIKTDGRLVTEALKLPGERIELTPDQEVLVTLGNAGGVALTINGQRARPLGRPGDVVRDIRISRDNYRDYLASD